MNLNRNIHPECGSCSLKIVFQKIYLCNQTRIPVSASSILYSIKNSLDITKIRDCRMGIYIRYNLKRKEVSGRPQSGPSPLTTSGKNRDNSEQDTCGYSRADNTAHIRPHCMHKEEVLRICLLTNFINNSG